MCKPTKDIVFSNLGELRGSQRWRSRAHRGRFFTISSGEGADLRGQGRKVDKEEINRRLIGWHCPAYQLFTASENKEVYYR